MSLVPEIPKDYFEFQKSTLKVFGISIDGKDSLFYKVYSFVLLLTTPFSFMFLGYVEMFMEHQFEELSVTLVYSFCMTLDAGKVIVMLLRRKDIAAILKKLQQEVFLPHFERGGELEDKLIKDCLKFNYRLRKFYLTVTLTSLSGTVLNTLFKRLKSSNYADWELGFCSFTIINVTYSPNFEIMMIYQDIAVVCGALQFISFDMLFVAILSNICVQFKFVQNSLKRIVSNSHRKMIMETRVETNFPTNLENFDASVIPLKYLQEAIKNVVTHHLAVIKVVAEVEKIYSTMLLIIYLASMILLCLGLYLCTIVSVLDTKMLIFVSGMLTLWCQTFCICYWCDNVAYQSMAVGKAICEANFPGTRPSFQKDLILIMKRSFKPTTITAGKFFNITLDTFMRIQKAAYSIFMVIRK